MSGLETAIRNALDRSDRANPEIRARIYQSARQALEAGLRKQDITAVDVVSTQRHRLEETIRAIEGEERARLRTQQVPIPPVVEMPLPQRQDEAIVEDNAPSIGGETRSAAPASGQDAGDLHAQASDHFGIAPTAEERVVPLNGKKTMDFKPEAAIARRKPRKIFARLLIFSVVVAFVGIGAWWAYSSGLLLTAAQRDTSVANPPPSTDPQDFDGTQADDADQAAANTGLANIDPQNGFSDEWLEIYAPGDSSAIKAGSQAKVEKISENDGPAVRVTSATGGDDGTVSIEIPSDVLQKLAGKTSTFALTLQSSSDVPTQITVACDFQSLGDCGRHRFRVNSEKGDQLFQVRFDTSLAPNSPGHLLVNSDVEGKGRGINLFGLRVLPGQ